MYGALTVIATITMNKHDNIEGIVGLMKGLMLSVRVPEPHPWLDLKLTREQLRIMLLLYSKVRSSPEEVAASFGVPRANVTGTIDRLVKKGMAAVAARSPLQKRAGVRRSGCGR